MSEVSSVQRLAAHALDTLPDSIAARRGILKSVVYCLPKDSELRTRSKALLTQLEMHEQALRQLQGELPLLFNPPNKQ